MAAARINVRALLILIIVFGFVGGGVGGYLLFRDKDARFHHDRAAELVAGGRLAIAHRELENVLRKEPRMEAAIAMMHQVHAELRPDSQDAADEYLQWAFRLANHRAFVFAEDAEAQRTTIRSLRALIPYASGYIRGMWEQVRSAGERLADLGDERAEQEGRLAEALWLVMPESGGITGADRTDEQRAEGIGMLYELVEERPEWDDARAALLEALTAAVLIAIEEDAPDREIDEKVSVLQQAIDQAEAALPIEGTSGDLIPIRTATAALQGRRLVLIARNDRLRAEEAVGGDVAMARDASSEAAAAADASARRLREAAIAYARTATVPTPEAIVDAAKAWAAATAPDDDHRIARPVDAAAVGPRPGALKAARDEYLSIVADAVDALVIFASMDGSFSTGPIIDAALARDGLESNVRLRFVELLARSFDARRPRGTGDATDEELLGALRTAVDETLALPDAPVGIDATLQRPLRLQAHVVRVDSILFEYDRRDPSDDVGELRAAAAAAGQAVEEAVRDLGLNVQNDEMARYARAMVAFVQDDPRTASSALASLLEADGIELRQDRQLNAVRVYAWALQREGAFAQAAALLEDSLARSQGSIRLLRELVLLRLRLNELPAATALVDRMEQEFPGHDRLTRQLRAEIERRAGRTDDPLQQAVSRIEQLAEARRFAEASEEARALAEAADDERRPRFLRLAGDLAREAGDREMALEMYRRLQDLQPEDEGVRAMVEALAQDDPIERIVTMARGMSEDPVEQAVAAAMALERQLGQARRFAAASTDPDRRAELEAFAARLEPAVAEWRAQVEGPPASTEPEQPSAPAPIDSARPSVRERWHSFRLEQAIASEDWAAADAAVASIATGDLDGAQGSTAVGRLALARARSATGSERDALLDEAVSAFSSAQSRLPFSAEVSRQLGRALVLDGEVDRSASAYEVAWRNDPVSSQIAREYASVLISAGRPDRALQIVEETASRNPGNLALRELRLELELELGNDGRVLLERRRIHAASPDDLANALRYARLLMETAPTYQLLVDEQGRPLVSPGEWARMSARAQSERLRAERRAWIEEADALIDDLSEHEAAASDEMQLNLSLLRAMQDRATGRPEDAADRLRTAIETAGTPATRESAVAAAAVMLSEMRLFSEAIEILRQERARLGTGDAARQWLWYEREVFQQAGRPQLAVPALEELRERLDGGSMRILVPQLDTLGFNATLIDAGQVDRSLVESLLVGGRVAEARALWDEASDPEVPEWLRLDASILAREADAAWLSGDEAALETATEQFERRVDALLEARPDDPNAWALRIRRLVDRSQREGRSDLLDDAEQTLEEAEGLMDDPGALLSSRILLLETRGDDSRLAALIAGELEERPGNDTLRARLFDLYERLGRLDDAERAAREAVERYGPSQQSMQWRERLGRLLAGRGDHAGAATVFADAFAVSGDDPALLGQQAQQMLLMEPPAVRRVADMLGSREAEMTSSPGLRAIYARALDGLGREVPSERQFELSLRDLRRLVEEERLGAGNLGAWVEQVRLASDDDMSRTEERVRRLGGDELEPWILAGLARGWAEAGDPARAAAYAEQALEATPPDAAFRGQRLALAQLLGRYRLSAGRPEEALAAYERALAESPGDPGLLNNVAFLRATELGDAEGALPLALEAVARRPRDWAILDTAGKICAMLERWEEAESYLRQSIISSERALNVFHLAEILAATDRRDEALRLLERASELDPDDEQLRTRIDALADQLAGVGG